MTMKRGLMVALALLSCLGVAAVAYCQELTEREREIYYACWERYYAPYTTTRERVMRAEIEALERAVAAEYGIIHEEMKGINKRGFGQELTPRQWDICYEFINRYDALSTGLSKEEEEKLKRKVGMEIAAKYGISFAVLADLLFRGMSLIL